MARVLVVCTANLCRSPMATAILRRHLEQREIPASVASAGLLESGRPAVDGALRALTPRGLDAGEHRSRRLEAGLVHDADLVITMERAHVREVALLDPEAWPRTFTLKELVRRAAAAGPRTAVESLSGWLTRVGVGRRRVELLGSSRADDVVDPMGGAPEDYDATADELDALLTRLVDLAWPRQAS